MSEMEQTPKSSNNISLFPPIVQNKTSFGFNDSGSSGHSGHSSMAFAKKGSAAFQANIIIEDDAEEEDDQLDQNQLDTEIQNFIAKSKQNLK